MRYIDFMDTYERTQQLLYIGTGDCRYYYIGQHIGIIILRSRTRNIGKSSSARPRGGSERRLLLDHLVHLAPVTAGGAAVEARPVTAGIDGGLIDGVHVAQ